MDPRIMFSADIIVDILRIGPGRYKATPAMISSKQVGSGFFMNPFIPSVQLGIPRCVSEE